MGNLYIFIVFVTYLVSTETKHLPSYITACKRANPNEGDCPKNSANAAIPHLVKGDDEYKIPKLDPLKLPKLEMTSGPNLKLTLTDVSVFGLERLQIQRHTIDPVAQRVEIYFKSDWLSLSSQYSISGQILVLPITGSGAANMTFYDSKFDHKFDYKLIKKADGKEYIKRTTSETGIDIEKSYFHLENLFNGNKELGTHMNNFLNENSKDVVRDLGYPVIRELIEVLASQVLNAIFSVVPFDEVLTN